jgi:glycosyltransferase involved in cell wall biosynthesis
MKIVYCIPSLYSHGGMEKTLTIKANHLTREYGHEIIIITTDGKDRPFAFELCKKILVINLNINFDALWKYGFLKQSFLYLNKQRQYKKKLKNTLNSIKPDITISMLRREINFLTDIKDGSIKIGELHLNRKNFRDFSNMRLPSPIKKIFATLWTRQLVNNLRRLDKFVVLSHEDKTQWTGVDDVRVIYNALSHIPTSKSDCMSKKVIAAGRFVPQKGFDMLIASWGRICDQFPGWELHIYGGGEKDDYYTLIEKELARNCFLHDATTDINSKFKESSIFAFSSRFEGFGMVITEAMSCGIPAVAFACPCGPKDIITHEVDGLLCEPGNTDSFSKSLVRLMSNTEERVSMGKNAYERSKDFSIEIIGKKWNDLFVELCQNHVTPS